MIGYRSTLCTVYFVSSCALAAAQWPTVNGAPEGGHYSSLRQINQNNVTQLTQQWQTHTGDVSDGSKGIKETAFEATPIFFQQRLYTCTPFNRVLALHPGNGKILWQFDPKLDLKKGSTQSGFICRGVASWTNPTLAETAQCKYTIFTGTQDGRLIALDAKTGQPCQGFGTKGQVDLQSGILRSLSDEELTSLHVPKAIWPVIRQEWQIQVGQNSAPAVIDGKVVVGMSLGDNLMANMPLGVVRAFDSQSGKLAWTFNPVPESLKDKSGAMNVWAPIAVDTQNNTVVIGTSSPSPDYYGVHRKQDTPYANAVITLDAKTGKPRWHYPTVHHDLYDYDLAAPPTLVTIEHKGQSIPVVIQATKSGFVFVLNRLSGESLFPIEQQSVPSSTVPGEQASLTQPVPLMPKPLFKKRLGEEDIWGLVGIDRYLCLRQFRKLRYEGMFTPASEQGSLEFPFTGGGINWGGVAYSPDSNLLIVNYSRIGQIIQLIPRAEAERKGYETKNLSPMFGTPYALFREPFLSIFGVPCTAPPWGGLAAIDMDTGEYRWKRPFGSVKKGWFRSLSRWGSPNLGGALVTGSGLVFIGASMDNFFHAIDIHTGETLWRTTLPAQGAATPMTYEFEGKQYVVIAAGGSRGVSAALRGDAIVAYALP